MNKPKIKVSVERLLTELRRKRDHAGRLYVRDLERYEKAYEDWRAKAIEALERALERAKAGKLPRSSLRTLYVETRCPEPHKPANPLTRYDRLIRTLEMAEGMTTHIAPDELDAYLEGR